MYSHNKDCDCGRCRPESDSWCGMHKVPKKWLITSSFCPKCEEAAHGTKGKTKSQDDIWAELNSELEAEVTTPMGNLLDDDLFTKWQASYGEFLRWETSSLPSSGYSVAIVTNGGTMYKAASEADFTKHLIGKSFRVWLEVFAEWWPV